MTRYAAFFLILGLAIAPLRKAHAAAETVPAAKAVPAANAAPAVKEKTGSKRPAKKANGKSKSKSNESAGGKAASANRSGSRVHAERSRASGGLIHAGIHAINADAQVTPFPSHAAAVRKAFAQNRRDQLDDAEKTARAPRQEDRWQTVLFHLRDFDARADREACYWRVVAYYRLGEMSRARAIRQLCSFDSREEAVLDVEDATCGSLQPAAVMPEMLAAGERPPDPVANPAPFAGAPPAREAREDR